MKAKLRLPIGGTLAAAMLLTFATTASAQNGPGKISQTSYCPHCQHGGYSDQGAYCDHCDPCLDNRHCRSGFGRCRTRISAASYARPPVLPPVRRYPKVYNRYWADHVTRDSGSAVRVANYPSYPMIHTPTDTTQLGYTYVHVPYFHFRPEMLPPAPGPSWGTAAHCRGAGYTTYDSSGFLGFGSHEEGVPMTPSTAPSQGVSPTPIQQQAPTNGPSSRPEPTPIQGIPASQSRLVPTPAPIPQADQYFTGGKSS